MKNTHLIGDINVNYLDKQKSANLKNISKVFNMRQVISSPTRVTDTTSSLIDWYLTNSLTAEAVEKNGGKITQKKL